jgi:tetratricopeptide (TPR) repeat protein
VRSIAKNPNALARNSITAITILGLLVLTVAPPLLGQTGGDWQQRVQDEVKTQHLDSALAIVDQRLADAPQDFEAHGWRGRLLAWKGRWSEAVTEYQLVLKNFPDDTDILTGLADVLLWQKNYPEALQVLDRARTISPSDPEILTRRARVLALLGRPREARSDYQEVFHLDAENVEARAGLTNLDEVTKHEIRIGDDIDFLSYANDAQTQSVSLSSRWNNRWSTIFAVDTYQRFGQDAVKFQATGDFHVDAQDWVGVGSAVANGQGVVPTNEAFFEFGHAFRFNNPCVRGLESSYQQHWFWYQGAHVLTLATNQIVYLPRGWTWSLNVTGARTGFSGTPVDWTPSGWSKLGFPIQRRITGNVFYGVGSENFSQIDQIGRFSAHTYGGGVRYRFANRQDINAYVAYQSRSLGQTDTTLGLSYGIRF